MLIQALTKCRRQRSSRGGEICSADTFPTGSGPGSRERGAYRQTRQNMIYFGRFQSDTEVHRSYGELRRRQ